MVRRLRSVAALLILHCVRAYFTGRTAVQETQKAAREGRIVGGHVRRSSDGTVKDLVLFWAPDGGMYSDSVRLCPGDLRYQKGVGWVFHE